LLIFSAFPLAAQADFSVFAGAGTLWVSDEGNALYYHNSFSLNMERFFLSTEWVEVTSDLPYASGSATGVSVHTGFDTALFGAKISMSYFKHSPLSVSLGQTDLYSEGGSGFLVGLSLPVHIGGLTVSPSFFFGDAFWEDGSFYWFFGKPDISRFGGGGLSLDYKGHTLSAFYGSLAGTIQSNEGETLFDADAEFATVLYAFEARKNRFTLGGVLGWLFGDIGVTGGLTPSNQRYAVFPYRFYNADALGDAHIVYGGARFSYTGIFFRFSVLAGAAGIIAGNVSVPYEYEMKKLFGGSKGNGNLAQFSLENTGAAFLKANAETRVTRRSLSLLIGAQKIFAVPWGFEKFRGRGGKDGSSSGGISSSGIDSETVNKWAKIILLSGLSLYARLQIAF
jgi:hypothetical protein